MDFWNTGTRKGGTMAANLTNESSELGTPGGHWTEQIAIQIGSGDASLTATTEALSTFSINPNPRTTGS